MDNKNGHDHEEPEVKLPELDGLTQELLVKALEDAHGIGIDTARRLVKLLCESEYFCQNCFRSSYAEIKEHTRVVECECVKDESGEVQGHKVTTEIDPFVVASVFAHGFASGLLAMRSLSASTGEVSELYRMFNMPMSPKVN